MVTMLSVCLTDVVSQDESENAYNGVLGWCRYLGIDEKAWVGLEYTSLSPDAMHHIEAVIHYPSVLHIFLAFL